MSGVIHESLGLPGTWRITSFSKLVENPRALNPDLRIRAQLAQLTDLPTETHKPALIPPVIDRLVPIGEIPLLYWDAILQDGEVRARTVGDIEEKVLDFRKGRLKVFHRSKEDLSGELILPMRGKWQHADDERSGLFVGIRSGDDPYATIIPTYEILRFFYATSSHMIKALLRGDFLDPHKRLWDMEKSIITDDGRAILWLRKWMLDVDAPYLARFAFNEYALMQAQQIFLYASASKQQRTERLIRALPPIQELASTSYVCQKIWSGGRERTFISRILSCNCSFPYTELRHDRDNPGSTEDLGREKIPKKETNGVVAVPATNGGSVTLSETPPDTLSSQMDIEDFDVTERFPTLSQIPKAKLEHESTSERKSKVRAVELLHKAYSVVEGKLSGSLIGTAVIRALQNEFPTEPVGVVTTDETTGIEDFLGFYDLLQRINNETSAKVERIQVFNEKALVKERKFSVFPETPEDERKLAWRYMSEQKKLRRMVLVARVTLGDKSRHIIEVQHKRKNECATAVVWNYPERPMSPQILTSLLEDFLEHSRVTFPRATTMSLRTGSLKHTTDLADKGAPEAFLQRIFDAVPSKNQQFDES